MSNLTITASKLNVRQQPDQGAAVLAQLPQDTRVEKLGASADGQWFQIRTAAGTSGWIAAKYAVESPTVATFVSVNASMLNLRQSAAPTASVIRKLPQGTVLQKLADSADGQWVQVRTPDGADTGWVSATYVVPAAAPAGPAAPVAPATVVQPAAPSPAPAPATPAQPVVAGSTSGAMAAKSLAYRCLALTAGFETEAMPPECFAGLAGDFDGQAMSFGVLQWNLGQGTLQPLLRQMDQENAAVVQEVMGDGYGEFKSFLAMGKDAQMAWARGKQASKKWQDPWRSRFKALGRTAAMQQIQVDGANARYKTGLTLVQQYGLWSERGAALMFDIVVQNGSIKDATRQQIMADFATVDTSLSREDQEVLRMRIIGNRRAEAANSKFVEDVRSRKLAIANGSGKVHGAQFNLEATYGIRLVPIS